MKNLADKKPKILWAARNFALMLLFPIANLYLFELYIRNPFKDMNLAVHCLNIFLFELLMLTFFLLFGSLKWSLRLQSIFFMIVGLANYYILDFRSAPIMPWDIYSFGTAMSVAGNFKYTLEKQAVFVIIGFALLIMMERFVDLKIKPQDARFKKAAIAARAFGVCVCLFALYRFTGMLHDESTIIKYKMYNKLFTPTVITRYDGTAVAFLMELKYVVVEKPENYSTEAAEEILSPYKNMQAENASTVKNAPNIIVIMNESFSDPTIIGDFKTNCDYMPFVRSVLNGEVENTSSGILNVSVLGGNTANTEFEFLTGDTMAFLPMGSVPYQQYLKNEHVSLASHLKSLGYRTISMHPYNSTGWDRNKVYPLLGFDEMYFVKDFKNPKRVRKYVSDRSCYDKIIKMYEEKSGNSPLFVFNVTMQNHSSYSGTFDNFYPDVEVDGSKSEQLKNYLSLIKISDEEIRSLVEYFKDADEDTIIVFFGDHQPTNSVISDIWKQNGKNSKTLSDEEEFDRYKVPFFIWSNFDADTKTGIETSANFLALTVLERSRLPLYDYGIYLEELSAKYPVITSIRAVDANGQSTDIKNVMDELNDYAILQYDSLFGKE